MKKALIRIEFELEQVDFEETKSDFEIEYEIKKMLMEDIKEDVKINKLYVKVK